eukprot:TRINITY_DN7301_c0_g1_i1.p1 TRINITY_DN7301_c0_g1~~TRINITY_DN7301_c0_g1_i1.p1  ORF type:complete len:328 (-),score=57.57 TRINITY_DN7301_c0_g1_i1:40-1023(-)
MTTMRHTSQIVDHPKALVVWCCDTPWTGKCGRTHQLALPNGSLIKDLLNWTAACDTAQASLLQFNSIYEIIAATPCPVVLCSPEGDQRSQCIALLYLMSRYHYSLATALRELRRVTLVVIQPAYFSLLLAACVRMCADYSLVYDDRVEMVQRSRRISEECVSPRSLRPAVLHIAEDIGAVTIPAVAVNADGPQRTPHSPKMKPSTSLLGIPLHSAPVDAATTTAALPIASPVLALGTPMMSGEQLINRSRRDGGLSSSPLIPMISTGDSLAKAKPMPSHLQSAIQPTAGQSVTKTAIAPLHVTLPNHGRNVTRIAPMPESMKPVRPK